MPIEDRATGDEAHKGFTHSACPYMPCHAGIERAYNCLFCYCPLYAYDCPGPYRVVTDSRGIARKDCRACTLPHDGQTASWRFIRAWLRRPVPWTGAEQTRPQLPETPEQAADQAG